MTTTTPPLLAGERLAVAERMIVSPAAGVFRPKEGLHGSEAITAGEEVGVVEGPGTVVPVRSPFGGQLMGVLAHHGERLRAGQAVAWLRAEWA
jgi:[acyl-carrier-protein] S-malonyltransferase